jgi:hypothetical protein
MAQRQKANPGLVFADQNNVLDDSDDESYEDSDSDDDDWSQPSGLNEDDHGNYMPPNDGDTGSTDDDPDDPVDNDLADEPSDDESIGDFDVHADDDDDTEPAPEDQGVVDDYSTPTTEEAGVTDDDADDSELITEESGVPDGEVELSINDTNEGTASAEDQGVSDKASVQDADEMDTRYGRRASRYNLRQRKKPSFTHLKTFSDVHVNVRAAHANVGVPPEQGESLATAQMSMNKGLKLFVEAGIEAVRSEMAQLHDRKVMKPVHSRELTPEEWREALAYLMFLKRKRCGKVKGRGCADGRKQRRDTDRADAASPTVATEAVFLTVVIDALENRDVAVVDIRS